MMQHEIVSRGEWLTARSALLEKEKAFTKLGDQLSAEQRALPWVKIEKTYVFEAPTGKMTLAALFRGRSQLFIKHFMMGPGQTEQCVGCSLETDHVQGILEHIENHDISYVAVARAPIQEIEVVRNRMGWRSLWVSSFGSDFNYDFDVSFTPEQIASGQATYNYRLTNPGMPDLSGDSIFFMDEAGQIFHTYSSFGRGGEEFLGVYAYFDKVPKGRNENGPYYSLADWARPRSSYDDGGMVEGNGRFHPAVCACATHK